MPVKKAKTPSEALTQLIEEYQINAFSLSKAIKINYQTVLNIINGSNRITLQTAMKLGKYFGKPPEYWIDIQTKADIVEISSDKKFIKSLNAVSKAPKPKAKAKPAAVGKQKTTKKTTKQNTLAEKRKKAAKVPGARSAKRKPKAKYKK